MATTKAHQLGLGAYKRATRITHGRMKSSRVKVSFSKLRSVLSLGNVFRPQYIVSDLSSDSDLCLLGCSLCFRLRDRL
ncbi:hypothetical protein CF335_g9309 [Tilletia laevis]|nr:hypothetical protein CF335_g9309 [Tilletia laevis]